MSRMRPSLLQRGKVKKFFEGVMDRCKKNLKIPPKDPCSFGKNKKCPWWVEDRKANYCMWKWIEQNDPLGEKVNTYEKLGKALGLTGAAIHQNFFYKIRKKLKELLENDTH